MKFNTFVKKLLEDFNVAPRAKHFYNVGPNIDNRGPLPTGFKGSNLPGIAPDSGNQVLIKLPKKKKKKK